MPDDMANYGLQTLQNIFSNDAARVNKGWSDLSYWWNSGQVGSQLGAYIDAFTGKAQVDMAREQIDWEKEAQQTTWDREDTAAQRRTADLLAAGLSPTLAAGSAASTSQPIKIGGYDSMQKGFSQRAQSIGMLANIGKTLAEALLIGKQADKVGSEVVGIDIANEKAKQILEYEILKVKSETLTSQHREAQAYYEKELTRYGQLYQKMLNDYLIKTYGVKEEGGATVLPAETMTPAMIEYLSYKVAYEWQQKDFDFTSIAGGGQATNMIVKFLEMLMRGMMRR